MLGIEKWCPMKNMVCADHLNLKSDNIWKPEIKAIIFLTTKLVLFALTLVDLHKSAPCFFVCFFFPCFFHLIKLTDCRDCCRRNRS